MHERRDYDHKAEDAKNPWVLEQTSKSSNFFHEKDFKEFLRQKFYETIKSEWKKYDWKNDEYPTQEFEEWIKESKFKDYFGSYDWDYQKVHLEDGYKSYCILCWNEKRKAETRKEWMKNNPYSNDQNLESNWLESYQPYKDWLEEHTEQHDNQVFYVAPVRMLKDFIFPEGKRLFLRDYDEATWQELFEYEGEERKINYERIFDRLEERGKWNENRLDRDLDRWRSQE